MSRTTLCVATAGLLAAGTVALMIARHRVLGPDVGMPTGPEAWKVTLIVHGRTTGPDAYLATATPLKNSRQHILKENSASETLTSKVPEDKSPGRRIVTWDAKPGAEPGAFEARYECFVAVHHHADPAADRHAHAPPGEGQFLNEEADVEANHPDISAVARRVTPGKQTPADVAEALFRFVDEEIANEPTVEGSSVGALGSLRQERGDSGAKSRLLVALCRNRGIPARLVSGLTLTKQGEQSSHVWAKVWVSDRWRVMCPFYHHSGELPKTYLVFGYDDMKLIHGKNVRVRDRGFLVERLPASATAGETTWARRAFTRLSPYSLPPAERRLVAFLMLLPIGALIVCVFRNLIGVATFGTFAPALLGLAFREAGSVWGILIFVSILLVGWLMRRSLDRFHLLQVPRTSVMLSLVVVLLCVFVGVAHANNLNVTKYISLYPLVILTGMIERFWTLEEEDSTAASFRTLMYTIGVATIIALTLSWKTVHNYLMSYPEAVGLVIASQLLLGRYTGYRLTELYRFRDFTRTPETAVPARRAA
jgi:hypothetical protein